MSITQGYLVVLKSPDTYGVENRQRYKGVNRVPSYRLANQDPIDLEAAAMERYVFGDMCDEDTGLIPSHRRAVELLEMFDRSPREFELIWCQRIPQLSDAKSPTAVVDKPGELVGFDVAGPGGEFWSIVADLPMRGPIARFRGKLNENGLFSKASDAWEYLREYQRLKLPDHDTPFAVLEVRRVG